MRISDWSSDVGSSDLHTRRFPDRKPRADVDAAAHEAKRILRPRDRGRDCSPRPDPGRHGPSLSSPPRGQGETRISEARAARGAREDARRAAVPGAGDESRSEEHTSELQSLMRISYAVFCLKKKNKIHDKTYKQIA